MKKVITVAFALMASITLIQCNEAIDGYNAPTGSTLSYTPGTASAEVCGGGERLVQISAIVTTPNSLDGEQQPSQKIFGQLEANGPIRLYVKKDTAELLEPFPTELTRVNNDNLSFTTDSRGLYDFVVGMPGVAPGESYSDCLNGSLGVVSVPFCVSVSCP